MTQVGRRRRIALTLDEGEITRGDRIRVARVGLGLRQADFAGTASASYLSRLERDLVVNPHPSILDSLYSRLGIKPEELLSDRPEKISRIRYSPDFVIAAIKRELVPELAALREEVQALRVEVSELRKERDRR